MYLRGKSIVSFFLVLSFVCQSEAYLSHREHTPSRLDEYSVPTNITFEVFKTIAVVSGTIALAVGIGVYLLSDSAKFGQRQLACQSVPKWRRVTRQNAQVDLPSWWAAHPDGCI